MNFILSILFGGFLGFVLSVNGIYCNTWLFWVICIGGNLGFSILINAILG